VQAEVHKGKLSDIGKTNLRPVFVHGKVFRGEISFKPIITDKLQIVLADNGGPFVFSLAEIDIIGENYIPGMLSKSGAEVHAASSAKWSEISLPATPAANILNLSKNMTADGNLNWDVPAGDWMIIRFGHTSRGAVNKPAVTGRGLEGDKFRKEITKLQFDQYLGKMVGKYKEGVGVLNAMWVDSWETGYQNWSPVFADEFKKRRGYDPLPYLPAMTGRAVVSTEASERFLWDVRRTISDLTVDNFLGTLTELGKPFP